VADQSNFILSNYYTIICFIAIDTFRKSSGEEAKIKAINHSGKHPDYLDVTDV
jgi:hypothetical protein